MSEQEKMPEMDPNALWRVDIYTDRSVGTIRKITPVKADGAEDSSRKPVFEGEAALMTPAGQLPLSFEIPASTLAEAVKGYAAALEKGYRQALEELQELRRRASSKLVIPKGGMGGMDLPPPSGKLKL